jgi:hypothetical protein
LRSFENTEEYLENDTYQPGFQLMTQMKVKKEEIYRMSVIALCQSVLTVCLFGWVRESSKTVTLQTPGKLVLVCEGV